MQTDATSYDIVGTNNVGIFWRLLALVVVVHANERNNCQHCWRKFVILALITAFSIPRFFLYLFIDPLTFFPQIIVFI